MILIDANILKESYIDKLTDEKYVKGLLAKLSLKNYKVLDSGQHGVAVLNLENKKVYKFTESENEFKIAKQLLNKKMAGLPFVYSIGEINGIGYYVRDFFQEISDSLAETIGEEIDEIEDYFYYNRINVRKSETNVSVYFDDKFLKFLEDVKRSLKSIGIVRGDFDVSGFSQNVMIDKNGDYVLADF